MAELGTFSVAVGERERSNVFVSLASAWENAQGESVMGNVSINVVGDRGEDGKRHLKERGGKATFLVDRIPGLITALQAAYDKYEAGE